MPCSYDNVLKVPALQVPALQVPALEAPAPVALADRFSSRQWLQPVLNQFSE